MDDVEDLTQIRYFIVTYNRHLGETEVRDFDDQAEAFEAYNAAEKALRDRGRRTDLEIVMIGAASVEDVKTAYPHYFATGTPEERMHDVVRVLVG